MLLFYPILIGDITQLDKNIQAMAISESLAKKFFGNVWESTALGETVHINDNGDFRVEAIYADFPKNSSIKNLNFLQNGVSFIFIHIFFKTDLNLKDEDL